MPDVQEFLVRPPLRCFGRPSLSKDLVCGARACWMRPAPNGDTPRFFCDRCRGQNDVPIVKDTPFRRITVSVSIMFAAADVHPLHAEAEAVARLEQLVQHAGGVMDVHGVMQQIGKGGTQAPTLATDRRAVRRG
jgi:hypothetical protein